RLVILLTAAFLLPILPSSAPGKASHRGWPPRTGVLWIGPRSGATEVGTPRNDELLGNDGSDVIDGGPGADVIWGDQEPHVQPRGQFDRLTGGNGDDWLYASHGTNIIDAGPSNDHIHALFGKGTIECGGGFDWIKLSNHSSYSVRDCE